MKLPHWRALRGRGLRWVVLPILVVPLVAALFIGFGRDPRAIPSPLIGKQMPEFSLTSLDGRTIDSAWLRGRPVLLNFWASWCVPACVEEHPVLLDAQRRYGDELAVVGVLYEDRVEDARAFLARYGDGGWPNLIDPGGRLAIEFGVTGPPESYLIDENGIVRHKQFGPFTTEALDLQVAALLSAGEPQAEAGAE